MTELEAAIAHGTAQSMAGRQSGDEEQRRYMAENHAILFDSNLQSLLQGMSQITYTDTEGNLGEPGAEYTHTIPKYVAASIAASPLIRTGWVTEKEARLRNWETESLFIQLKQVTNINSRQIAIKNAFNRTGNKQRRRFSYGCN
jgi:hypothetical protein